MRVLLNLSVASGKKSGVGYYAKSLRDALAVLPDRPEIIEFPPRWLRFLAGQAHNLRRWLPAPRQQRDGAMNNKSGLLCRLRRLNESYLAGRLKRFSRSRRVDLYHEPNYIPLAADVPTIATIHDLSVLMHPEWHPADRVAYFDRSFPRVLRTCEHFIAGSEFTRGELIRHFSVPPQRITRVYYGVRPDLRPMPQELVRQRLRRLQLPQRYLLYVGTIEPRKNLLMLMTAYSSLPGSIRQRLPLVLVGAWGWKSESLRTFYADKARHRNVRHIGYVPDEHLCTLYNGATALLYPSHYEGFGLPPVEMAACGGAVLASSAAAIREVAGAAAHLIDPDDIDGWRTAMSRAARDADWLQSLRLRAADIAGRYRWDSCAHETLAVYCKVLGKPVNYRKAC